MIDTISVEHHIQKYILSILMHQKVARFRDLRPLKADTNLFSYHLKLLQKNNMVEKCDGGYTLATTGLAYIDRVSNQKMQIRKQPKIITMAVIQDGYGNVLLQKRTKQPFIDTWTLPYGKFHIDDKTLLHAIHREVKEKTGMTGLNLSHAGDAYLRVKYRGELVSSTLAHIFYAEIDEDEVADGLVWCDPAKLSKLHLAPCVEQIVARTFFRDPHFFEEFKHEWQQP